MSVKPGRWWMQGHWQARIGLVIVLVAIFGQSYQGREALVEQARAGCERAKLDRTQQAAVLKVQAEADRALARDLERSPAVLRARIRRAEVEERAERSLRSRTGENLKCPEVFPHASPLPF